MALALSLLSLLALTTSFAPHSSRELFTEPQGALTNNSSSYAPSANTFYFHQSQQPLSLHRNKKPKFSSSLVSPKTLIRSFSNRLLPEQGKWGCRCTVSFSSKKQRWRGKALGWEHSNSLLLAVLTNKCHSIRSIRVGQPITLTSSPDLRNLRISTAPLILELAPNRANQWGTLSGQHW